MDMLPQQTAAQATNKAGKLDAVAPKPDQTLAVETSTTGTKWVTATNENVRLAKELTWTFGGKTQLGWSIYAPLIAETMGASVYDPDQPEFADSIARWQQMKGLKSERSSSVGTLDGDTWSALIQFFQERRIKDRQEPTEANRITIPITDCYDETRELALRQVEKATYAAYQRMVSAAIADPTLHLATVDGHLAPSEKFLKIVSAYRSREYQAELHRREPNATSAGLAINSPHVTGRALDLYVGGVPTSTADTNRAVQVSTPVYRWLVKNAARFGFQPYFYEPWHWEYNPQ